MPFHAVMGDTFWALALHGQYWRAALACTIALSQYSYPRWGAEVMLMLVSGLSTFHPASAGAF